MPESIGKGSSSESNRYLKAIERGIDRWVPVEETTPARLHRAMRYSLNAGGKRVRPLLLLAVGDCYGKMEACIPAAVAVECIHTYSLIHDDLPAMDDSDFRRGNPSCHRQFDEATAILAGDALLPLAFEILSEAYRESPKICQQATLILARAAGSGDLVGGQMMDIESERGSLSLDLETLRDLHQRKTGALLTASMQLGAVVAEVPEVEMVLWKQVGLALGLAFQIVDDLLDATCSSEQLGKTAATDAARGILTYIDFLGQEGAIAEVRNLTESAIKALDKVAPDASFLKEYIEALAARTF
ncbi:MAG: polyprenyl synthetase family protein [Puniceicoccaceae bacterium]